MDDMQAIEQRITRELLRRAGPSQPVDDAAIFTAVAVARSPGWGLGSVFGAARLVVAGAVVVLFGGFVLAALLTQQTDERMPAVGASASASATAGPADLLAGVDLVSEEVEPGVYRVLSDGVRELSRFAEDEGTHMGGLMSNAVAVGRDGSVWIMWPDGPFRLGDRDQHSWGDQPLPLIDDDVEVGPDSTLWRLSGSMASNALVSMVGGTWSVEHESVVAFDMQADGSVWVMADEPDAYLRLDADGWTAFDCAPQGPEGCWMAPLSQGDLDYEDFVVHGATTDFAVSPIVHDWLLAESEPPPPEVVLLAYLDGDPVSDGGGLGWWLLGPGRAAVGYDTGVVDGIHLVDMDDDGGYWAYQRFTQPVTGTSREGDSQGETTVVSLVHSDGITRSTYSMDDGVPVVTGFYHEWMKGFAGFLRAAPDGSVWLSVNADPGSATECDGLANFDGTMWRHHLQGTCIYAMDIAADGTVWLLGGEKLEEARSGVVDTYVITPAAGSADE